MSHSNCIQVSLDLKVTNFYFDSIFSRIKWLSVSHYPTYLLLKKQ